MSSCVWGDCPKPRTTDYQPLPLCDAHVTVVTTTVARVNAQASAQSVAARERRGGAGSIYYLQVGEHVKIGHSTDLPKRLATYPPTSVLLAVQPGTMRDEHDLHRRFAPWRAGDREWYQPTPEILDHIATVAARYDQPGDPFRSRRPARTTGGATRRPRML